MSLPALTATEVYDQAFRAGLRPDPLLTVSEWADRYRRLSGKSASEPGPYRTERTPYLREIMDALSPLAPVERVVVMKGAQLGFTEAANNWVGYVIHKAPGPMMVVQPTVEMAKRNSKQRIDPLIQESEALRELVRSPRSRDSGNTVLSKEFPGGVLVMTGANSAVGLRSMSARYLFLDEIDAYPGDVDGEGDPINLAQARTNRDGEAAIGEEDDQLVLGLAAPHSSARVTLTLLISTLSSAHYGLIRHSGTNASISPTSDLRRAPGATPVFTTPSTPCLRLCPAGEIPHRSLALGTCARRVLQEARKH